MAGERGATKVFGKVGFRDRSRAFSRGDQVLPQASQTKKNSEPKMSKKLGTLVDRGAFRADQKDLNGVRP